jgi:hypothetical protein
MSPSVRIYVYVLAHDGGFSPNPFHGWCTLACCKPKIRKKAQPGDWVVGLTRRRDGNRLAYAMKVEESLSFEDYWHDKRFRKKRPRWKKGASVIDKCGDNCYRPVGPDEFKQLPRSNHWDFGNDREDLRKKAADLGGERVLVSRTFCYYGREAIPFPAHVSFPRPTRGHRVNFTPEEQASLLKFIRSRPRGVLGKPKVWPYDDRSWKPGGGCG